MPGYLSLGLFFSDDHLLWAASEAGLSGADGVGARGRTPVHRRRPRRVHIGHIVGTVLLGLALLSSGRIPAWAAWTLTLSQPLHLVAAVILGSPQVDFFAWSLTSVGMAFVSREVC